MNRIAFAAAVAALASGPGAAFAAGFQLMEQNASGLGNAYAGQAAAAEDASTIYFNPAGLTRLPKRQIVAGFNYVRPSSTFSDGGSCAPYLGGTPGAASCPTGAGVVPLGHALGGGGGSASDYGLVPNLYASWELRPNQLWVGLGVNAPFGLKTNRDAGWIGRFHSTQSEAESININPTVAWKVNNAFSVGFGINAQHFRVKLGNAVSYRAAAVASGSTALIAAVPPGAEGTASINGDSWGWGWNAGVMFEPTATLRVGLAYRSTIKQRLKGDVRFDGRPAAFGAAAALADGDVEADVRLPDTWSLAVAWQAMPSLQLLADWTRTGWDSIQDLTVVRSSGTLTGQTLTSTALNLRNSQRFGLGANWQFNPAWKLRVGIAHDSSAARDEFRSPRLPDAGRMWYAIGAQWAPAPTMAVDVGFAYLRVDDAPSRLPNQENVTPLLLPRGSLVGSYGDASVKIFGVQGRWSF